ncbi:bifunctional 2',3'-cyclic-nucleotide 2'-phosphodiesterase/3'-nucleotidase [Aliiroseovarius sp.]|uniref:bifunctional 2',3'-cyclic-nucleotide 2'-phosphodiesterase/3'-nucleotidase n=1 Tax=Aliiroseovarius sp. TaxID=1872442 RepID=UPI00260B7653|nr:bifunctional 2',3'-cyclic-nucleotide 2'-phosphodiesterase/3'-nucleotidase [Aliiroseovarius sp.]
MDNADHAHGAEGAGRARLRILATTDLHMHILPYDYFTDSASQTRGLARTASLIHAARAEAAAVSAACLLVDNGDFLTGTPMDDEFAQRMARPGDGGGEPHPMISVMNALGYDAATLGNHDFDHGFAWLERVLEQAEFPLVLANLDRPPGHGVTARFLPPYTILTRQVHTAEGVARTLRIGVLGFLPPHSIRPRHTLKTPPETGDIVEVARRLVPKLRADGADLVLVLAHTGIGEAEHHPGQENALVPLSEVEGIDAIVGGHAHQVFPGPRPSPPHSGVSPDTGHVNGVPVVIPGFWGSHLGVIDLDLVHDGDCWRVAADRAELRATYQRGADGQVRATAPADPDIRRALAPDHTRTLHYVRTPVGQSAQRLHSYFSLIAPNAAVQLVQRAQRDFVARVLTGTPHASLPILSSASALKCGGIGGPDHYTDVPAGELTLRAIADLYLYPNDLVALKVTGAMMRDWLERAASVFNRLDPNRPDQPLIDPSTPSYLHETVLGLEYQIDLARAPLYTPRGAPLCRTAASGRVQGLSHRGTPVRDNMEFLLITNGFRASGGGRYPRPDVAEEVLGAGDCIRDILRDHVREGPVTDHAPDPHWRLTAAHGTTATLDCSPRALPLAQEIDKAAAGLHLSPLARLPSGFQQFRLTF